MATRVKMENIYSLPKPVWLNAAGFSKGINHNRQHPGIILPSGASMRMRQLNFSGNMLTLRLLNDDSHTETSASIGESWVTVSALATSVPFIDTPYGVTAPLVEYEYPSEVKTLPFCVEGGDEKAFFNSWDSLNAEFALISSAFVNILIPARDKEALRSLCAQNSIDNLLAGYARIFKFYNELAGISFDAEVNTDRNIHNRYFIKADKNGAGAAYYGNLWTAESTSSVKSFWLYANEPGWGCLHEIAHGYQGKFMSDRFIGVGEVWNNIYAACFQNETLGDRQYKEGWLYNYGNQVKVERAINDFISQGAVVNSWDLRSKLLFMMLMVNKAGMPAFTHFNQYYRQLSNQSGFAAEEHALLDMLSASFAAAGNRVNVTPFLDLVGGHVTDAQRQQNLFSHTPAVYPLNQLAQGAQLTELQQQAGLQSTLTLVDTDQLNVSNLKGSVTLTLNIDDLRQIAGETLQLWDGDKIMGSQAITGAEIVMDDLPIGVHTLHLPTGRSKKYDVRAHYLVVKTGKSALQVNYVPRLASPLLNQSFSLLGLGDAVFATVSLDHSNGTLAINVTEKDPHVYFSGEVYARIIVRNPKGEERYNREIMGKSTSTGLDEMAFTVGDSIEIFHREPSRLRILPTIAGVVDRNTATNTFTITASGIKNVRLNNDPQTDLQPRLEQASLAIAGNSAMLAADYAQAKDDLYLAVMALEEPLRTILRARYYLFMSAHNTLPEEPDIPELPGPGLYSQWEATRTYVGGDRVSHHGRNYLAKWWIDQGTEPGLESTTGAADGDGRPWTEI